METLSGNSLHSVRTTLSQDVIDSINREIGKLSKTLTQIQGPCFGLLADPGRRYDNLFDFIYMLIKNVLSDAKKKQVVIGISDDEILTLLIQDKVCFEAVTPSLVHWDMWEGNIFVKDGRITGIIDWERSMWSDPFMDDRFRLHSRTEEFLSGYEVESFTHEEMRRIYWYDLLLYLIMMTEGEYRGYEDDGQYHWAKEQLENTWKNLNI